VDEESKARASAIDADDGDENYIKQGNDEDYTEVSGAMV
jgi:hypothetical protein